MERENRNITDINDNVVKKEKKWSWIGDIFVCLIGIIIAIVYFSASNNPNVTREALNIYTIEDKVFIEELDLESVSRFYNFRSGNFDGRCLYNEQEITFNVHVKFYDSLKEYEGKEMDVTVGVIEYDNGDIEYPMIWFPWEEVNIKRLENMQ